jgi:ribosomal protein S18 acetylase RimI-like enzyme
LIAKTRGNDFIFVASVVKRVVGYLIVKIDISIEAGGTRAEITDFYVHEEFRRRGIGTRLLGTALAFARRKKARYIFLFTNPRNEEAEAQRLYRASGFYLKSADTVVFSQGLARGKKRRSGP